MADPAKAASGVGAAVADAAVEDAAEVPADEDEDDEVVVAPGPNAAIMPDATSW